MTAFTIQVVLPAGGAQEEGHGLVQAALDLAPGARVEVLRITAVAAPTAIAGQVATLPARDGPRLVLLPTGTEGEELAALIAERLDGLSLGRCSHIALEATAVVGHRAVFGGRAEVVLRSEAAVTCATLRAQAAAPVAPADRLRWTDVDIAEPQLLAAEPLPAATALPRLDGAHVVVSGGRGVGLPEGFELLARIARALGGGFAGSLPTVDAGWVPVAHQVGISGRFISPRVYLAVGISGTPQHLAGLAPQTRIVAVNNDRDAPIFGRCDVGVVGDWREILPALAQALDAAAPGG